MKKILIISYFFPPSPFTGSFRIYSWAKYLSESGYYPVIITRNWDVGIHEYKDMSKATIPEIIHRTYDNYEVYYLPYHGNLRDRLYARYGDKKMVSFRRILTFFQVKLQNFTTRVIPFRNLLHFSDKLLKTDQDIMCIITSGRPFVLFSFCFKLAKKYRLPWIADYRDEWNINPWLINPPLEDRWIMNFEKNSEKKWLSNSSCFTSISSHYVKIISDFIRRPGYVVMNGYDPDDYINIDSSSLNKVFTILFNGTLYDTQLVEIFTEAYKTFIKNNNGIQIKLLFLGLNFEKKQTVRIKCLLKGYEEYFEITDRLNKKEALEIMAKAHVFVMFSHKNIIGVTSSKIFDYLALRKPIILCPSDNEVLEDIVSSTKSGYICNTSEQACDTLTKFYNEFKETGNIVHNPDTESIKMYLRRNQTLKLANVLDNIFSGEVINKSLSIEKSFIRKFAFNVLNNGIIKSTLRFINGRNNIRILCFHNISDKSDMSYPSLNLEGFYNLIKYINKEYDLIPISKLHDILPSIKRPLILTFDDGYKDFINYALPVLKEFNAPAINNIIVDCVETNKPFWTQRLNFALSYIHRHYRKYEYNWGDITIRNLTKVSSPQQDSLLIYKKLLLLDRSKRNEFLNDIEKEFKIEQPDNWDMMNWHEIKTCVEHGIEIGSHTMTHDSLCTIDEKAMLQFEIYESKSAIEKHIGTSVNTLAFPNGIYDDRCINMAANAGYKYLLTTQEKYFHNNSLIKEMQPLILPRISINSNDNNENFLRIEKFHNIIK